MGVWKSPIILISSLLATCLFLASYAYMLAETKRIVKEDNLLFSYPPVDPAHIRWLDTLFFFTSDSAYKLLKVFGEEGRTMHLTFTIIDLFFPCKRLQLMKCLVAYMPLLIAILHQTSTTTNGILKFSPILVGICDWIQTIAVLIMLLVYPERWHVLAGVAGYFNAFKHTALFVVVGLVISQTIFFFFIAKKSTTAGKYGVRKSTIQVKKAN
jgi:hypothetical protein